MPTEIILPRVDMDMTSGRISRWYAQDGARVERGALLFDLETSKAAMEIDAPATGILRDVTAVNGDEIPVGQVIGWIYGLDETYVPPAKTATAARTAAPMADTVEAVSASTPSASRSGPAGTGIAATPLARRLAREQGLDLGALTGSGVRGRIQGVDVAAQGAAGSPAVVTPRARTSTVHRAWLRKGAGTPTVMLHGFGSELDSWRPLVIGTPSAGPVLAIDLPAHGKSAPVPSPGLEAIADAVAAVLAEEGITVTHLLGHSLGGAVATLLAIRKDIAARSLLLISSGGLGPEINGAFVEGFLAAKDAVSLAPVLSLTVADPRSLPGDFTSVSLRPRQREGYIEGLRALAARLFPNGGQTFTVREPLNGLDIPKRLVFGAADGIIPPSHASGLAGPVGVHLFAGIGHMPQIEAPHDISRIWLEVTRSAE